MPMNEPIIFSGVVAWKETTVNDCKNADMQTQHYTYLFKVGAGEVDAAVLDINEAILLQLSQHLINVLGVPCRACRHQALRYIRV